MPIRIVNVITRMIVGGPQQVSLLAGTFYRGRHDFEYHLVSGLESGPEGDYHREIEAAGIPLHAVEGLGREIAPFADLRTLFALARLFRSLRPEIVHARSAKARFLGPIAARLARVPVVVQTVHGWSFNNAVDRRRPLFIQLERVARACCDCNVFVSEQDLGEGISLGIVPRDALERGQAAVIRSGVDLSGMVRLGDDERERIRRGLGVTDGQRVVSLVQRLSEPKTPLIFVEAMRAVAARHPQAVAWIVGDGALRAGTERAVSESGLADRLAFLGVRKDIAALLSASDVVVHSSLREGLPRVVLETLSVGTPLVATAVGGVPEVVRDGENGLTVPHSDPAALARALIATLDDPEAAARRATQGRQAVRPFSAERMLAVQHDLYLRLLAARGITLPTATPPAGAVAGSS